MLLVAAEKLRDPDYFGLHLEALAAIREIGALGWYDAHFLRRYEVAKTYLAKVRPGALGTFIASFAPLIPAETFREIAMDDVFDAATHAAIVEASRNAVVDWDRQLEEENANFGRDVVWNEPFYLEL